MLLLAGEEKRRRSCIIFRCCSLLTRVCQWKMLPALAAAWWLFGGAGGARCWLFSPVAAAFARNSRRLELSSSLAASPSCWWELRQWLLLLLADGFRRWEALELAIFACYLLSLCSCCLLLDKRGEERERKMRR
uniref:Uncharacterized protein n=1 Tax=Solanum tuberosum TaxID=4113 RepID=M1B3Q3_SOLTU